MATSFELTEDADGTSDGEAEAVATSDTVADSPKRTRRKAAQADAAVAERPERPAARLGHFQLLEQIGKGGMGTVYSAYDLGLDRKVAIKLLDEHDTSHEEHLQLNQRLLREAQAMAKLSHPNVVPIYEVGLDGERLFIAMEYIAGQTLGSWLDQGPGWRAIVDVFAQAGRGLAAAHGAGIIHRDFKPGNVLLDGQGIAHVSDFGIALVHTTGELDAGALPTAAMLEFAVTAGDLTPPSASTPLTEVGAIIGTPAYMSPEQYLRSAVDARSDQFSFCVALYEALYGKRPFSGRGKVLAEQVTLGKFTPPDPSSPVPGWVSAIVLRGLAPDPDARFPSMTALVDALARDVGRRRKQLALGALGIAVIAGGAALAGWRVHTGREATCDGAEGRLAGVWDAGVRGALEHSFAATSAPFAATSAQGVETALDGYSTKWVAMRTDVCRATRIRAEQSERVLDLEMACLDRRLGEIRALTALLVGSTDPHTIEKAVEAAGSLTALGGCADTAALIAPGAAPSDPAARARRAALVERLDRLTALQRLGRAKEALAPARALVAEARAAGDAHVLAEALVLQGSVEIATGDLKSAEVTLEDSLRRARETGDPDLFAGATVELAEALAVAGISTSREGLGVVRVARAVVDAAHDPALPIRLLLAQGHLYLTLAHRELALPLLQEAAERARKALGTDHTLLFQVQAKLASVLSFNKRHAEARAEYTALIANATRTLGALHPTTVMARLDLCRASALAGAKAEAPACYDAVLPDADRVVGAENRGVITARAYYALTLTDLAMPEAARKVYIETLAHVPTDAWAEHWYIATDLARGLGLIELDLGDPKAALEHCQRAFSATEKQHRGLVDPTCIGEAQLALGDATAALATLEAAQPDTDPMADRGMAAHWRFVYARAVLAGRHDAARARALAAQARPDIEAADAPKLAAWLATVPAR